jgi:hypothetical protein
MTMFLQAIKAQEKMQNSYLDARLAKVETDIFSHEQKRKVWQLQSVGTPLKQIVVAVGGDRLEVKRLISRTTWPTPSEIG